MPQQVHDKKRMPWFLDYKKVDGSVGSIDKTNPTVITMVPEGGADMVDGGFDDALGRQTWFVTHNTSVGLVSITVKNDGDIGSGDVPINETQEFDMLSPGGAAGVTSSFGPEEDIPAPPTPPGP